ncbi:MAG: hypothetical protein OXG64_04030 [Chloroflexi bacterium]|nr:hypothetical protein [Chloroflexota bacterium]
MAQWLPNGLRVHAFAEHDAGVHMTKIFDTERRQASRSERTLKAVEHDAGVDGSSVGLGKDEIVILIERTEFVSLRHLADTMLFEQLDHADIERDGACRSAQTISPWPLMR